ncbi:MAG TPA: exodeoxyribonuclease VII large subunit [Clostridiales bacterium]|jgi:exodeoxyribonuclease VII large subunit|nr:exodeoxyribonuclease VII large subunit [Clostridiales bacterium]
MKYDNNLEFRFDDDTEEIDDPADRFEDDGRTAEPSIDGFSVTQLNGYIKNLMDCHPQLSDVTVWGEISNLRPNRSGHIYFTLKENDDSVIKAVMFRRDASGWSDELFEGAKALVHGRVELYIKGGYHQIICDSATPLGVGSWFAAFERLKRKLWDEGLLRAETKKPIPKYPRRIGIVTSPTGAALRDMMNVFRRRSPGTELYIYPSAVQGADAPAQLIAGIEFFNSDFPVDVIIIGRGGGSIEDLWCFNDENLAHAVSNSGIPVISGVGHEIDTTICDLAADLRAPTPSAAAEIAVPDTGELAKRLENQRMRLGAAIDRELSYRIQRLENAKNNRIFRLPERIYDELAISLDGYAERLSRAVGNLISAKRTETASGAGRLDALSPLKILGRGYGLITHDGDTVRSIDQLSAGDRVGIRLSDGEAEAEITSTREYQRKTN